MELEQLLTQLDAPTPDPKPAASAVRTGVVETVAVAAKKSHKAIDENVDESAIAVGQRIRRNRWHTVRERVDGLSFWSVADAAPISAQCV